MPNNSAFLAGVFLGLSLCVLSNASADEANTLQKTPSLAFASGEVVSIDQDAHELQVRVYLDSTGNYNRRVIKLIYNELTEFTDGKTDLGFNHIAEKVEVDVEYNPDTMMVSYVFVYA